MKQYKIFKIALKYKFLKKAKFGDLRKIKKTP